MSISYSLSKMFVYLRRLTDRVEVINDLQRVIYTDTDITLNHMKMLSPDTYVIYSKHRILFFNNEFALNRELNVIQEVIDVYALGKHIVVDVGNMLIFYPPEESPSLVMRYSGPGFCHLTHDILYVFGNEHTYVIRSNLQSTKYTRVTLKNKQPLDRYAVVLQDSKDMLLDLLSGELMFAPPSTEYVIVVEGHPFIFTWNNGEFEVRSKYGKSKIDDALVRIIVFNSVYLGCNLWHLHKLPLKIHLDKQHNLLISERQLPYNDIRYVDIKPNSILAKVHDIDRDIDIYVVFDYNMQTVRTMSSTHNTLLAHVEIIPNTGIKYNDKIGCDIFYTFDW